MTTKERLARVLWSARDSERTYESATAYDRVDMLNDVDAILAELQEPSEGALKAAAGYPYAGEFPDALKAMIQHIRDGGE